MKTLADFLKMTMQERFDYLRENPLNREQKKELLHANRVIASLFQQDRHWAMQQKRFEHKIWIRKKW